MTVQLLRMFISQMMGVKLIVLGIICMTVQYFRCKWISVIHKRCKTPVSETRELKIFTYRVILPDFKITFQDVTVFFSFLFLTGELNMRDGGRQTD